MRPLLAPVLTPPVFPHCFSSSTFTTSLKIVRKWGDMWDKISLSNKQASTLPPVLFIFTIQAAKAQPSHQDNLVLCSICTCLLATHCSSKMHDNKDYWTSHAETNKSVNKRSGAECAVCFFPLTGCGPARGWIILFELQRICFYKASFLGSRDSVCFGLF